MRLAQLEETIDPAMRNSMEVICKAHIGPFKLVKAGNFSLETPYPHHKRNPFKNCWLNTQMYLHGHMRTSLVLTHCWESIALTSCWEHGP
ncbi:unnamed protein product [Calypogeia fissa]